MAINEKEAREYQSATKPVDINRKRKGQIRGKKRRAGILLAAKELLIEKGYDGITLREVADAAGIGLSNLQYYYQTKSDLFHAVCMQLADEYMGDISHAVQTATTAKATMLTVVERCLYSWSQPELYLWLALYERSFHDPSFRKIKDESYAAMQASVESALRHSLSHYPEERLRNIAMLLLALLDGFVIRQYPTAMKGVELSVLENEIKAAAVNLIED